MEDPETEIRRSEILEHLKEMPLSEFRIRRDAFIRAIAKNKDHLSQVLEKEKKN